MVTTKTPTKKVKVEQTSAKKVKLEPTSAKKSAAKPQKPVVSELDPKTYVASAKLAESLSAVRKLQESFVSAKSDKKDLFEEQSKFVTLQVELKKIPANFTTFIHSISLPSHWRHSVDLDTCLIVPDINREPLEDRDLDLEQTKAKYVDMLDEANASELIKEILPMRQLRNEFRPPALRQKLSSEYGVFLCDRNLLRNKHSFLSRFLGKAFWVENKKVPLMLDFSVDVATLRSQIEEKLNQTNLYVSGKGSTLAVTIGSLEQSHNDLLSNLEVILTKVHELFSDNTRALTLKTDRSSAVTFFMDLATSNTIRLTKGNPALAEQERFVEDEFDFLANSSVRVYKDGTIRVMKKRKNPEADAEEGVEVKVEEEDKPERGEEKFIKSINAAFAGGDHDWVRRKVTHMKGAKKGIKRLRGGRRNGRFFTKNSKGAKSGSKTGSKAAASKAKVSAE